MATVTDYKAYHLMQQTFALFLDQFGTLLEEIYKETDSP
jgi:hypothetical protein